MKLRLLPKAQKHLAYWKKQDQKGYERIKKLLHAITQDSFSGIGKPEPLKYELAGWWSRRISKKHRLVYKVENDTIVVLSYLYHYE